jgi:hypothetical protein
MNPQVMPANVRLSLAKSDGTPFLVTLQGKGTESSFDFKLEPNGSVILQTDGSGPLTVGTATIDSDVPIGASGIFSVLDAQGRFQTEAGVGASSDVYGATLPVDITGKFDTGVAFLNTSSTTVELTLTLLNENGEVVRGSTKILLPGMNHTAKLVSELFPGTANFRGSLAVSGASIVALTLRQNSSPLSYTTLPVRQGVSRGKILPLQNQTKTGIAATGDVVANATLTEGFKLAGKIDGPGYLGRVVAQSSMGEVFLGRIGYSLSGPKYLLVVPAGTYTLKVCHEAQGGYADITYTNPSPVRVTADTKQDITLQPANLTDISGTVSGLSNLPPTQSKSIVFSSIDSSVWVQFWLADDGKHTGKITPGSYRTNLCVSKVQFPDGRMQEPLTVFNFGAVTVGSSAVIANFALPPLARLSGRLSGTDVSMTEVYAFDRSAPAITYDSCGYFPAYSITGSDALGQYQLTWSKIERMTYKLGSKLCDTGAFIMAR